MGDEFMEQIAQLNDELQKEVKKSEELEEQIQSQNLDLDNAEERINSLTADNAEKNEKLNKADNEIAKLKKQLKNYKSKVKEYRRTYPDYNPKIIVTSEDMENKSDADMDGYDSQNTDMGSLTVPNAKLRDNRSMIVVDQMENYLKTLGSTQKDFVEFSDNIQQNITVLPEIRAEFAEKHEKATEFYGDIKEQQTKLQDEMSSMKALLTNLARNYDSNIAKFEKQFSSDNRMLSMQYALSDGSLSDDGNIGPYDKQNTERSNQTMINIPQTIHEQTRQSELEPLIESENKNKSCWSSIFYCGGDNDDQIQRDINYDDQQMDNRNSNASQQYYNSNKRRGNL